MGFDHELSDEAEKEMENEEELILKGLGWKGKGLIHSAYDAGANGTPHIDPSDGNILNEFSDVGFFKYADLVDTHAIHL